jgi:hypothetical protein
LPKDRKESRENIFEILDGIMFQISKTKKMFLIMILTILIIPPVALLAMSTVTEQPFQEQLKQRLQERLESGDITQQELENIKNKFGNHKPRDPLHPPQLIIIVISLAWLGIGIRQWIVLSRWDKRYQNFKTEQKKIDEQLEDDPDEK